MDYSITLYERPGRTQKGIVEQISHIIENLTGVWFTSDVVDDARKDLLFHDVMCLEMEGEIQSFVIFTSFEGAIFISLMGTSVNQHRKGLGSILMNALLAHTKSLGFDKIVVLTVPPGSKLPYQQTVDFYEKHGFRIEKEYSELWDGGCVQLVKNLV